MLCEGSGHAGVGSVFDLSNAQVAKILGAKSSLSRRAASAGRLTRFRLNQALFEKEGVEIIGVIINKVQEEQSWKSRGSCGAVSSAKGWNLLGVMPHRTIAFASHVELIRDELNAELLNQSAQLQTWWRTW